MIATARYIVRPVLYILLAFAVLWIAVHAALPRYLESHLIPDLSKRVGVGPLTCRIQHIGLATIDASDILVGGDRDTGMSIDGLHLDYTLMGLLDRQIHQIKVSGARIPLHINEEGVFLPGIPSLSVDTTTAPPSGEGDSVPCPAVSFERFNIRNSVFFCLWRDKTFQIPFELEMIADSRCAYRYLLYLFPRGQEVSVTGNIDLSENAGSLSVNSSGVLLAIFKDLVSSDLGLTTMDGIADMNADAVFRLTPFHMERLSAELSSRRMDVGVNGFRIHHPFNADPSAPPLRMSLETRDLIHWNSVITDLVVSSPLGSASLNAEATFQRTASKTTMHEWRFDVSGTTDNFIRSPEAVLPEIRFNTATFQLSVRHGENGLFSTVEAIVPPLVVSRGELEMKIPHLSLTGRGIGDDNLTLSIDMANLRLKEESIALHVPTFNALANVYRTKASSWAVDGMLSVSEASVELPGQDIRATNIFARIPLHWPPAGRSNPGAFRVGSFQWSRHNLGALNTAITQDKSELKLAGTMAGSLFTDCVFQVTGEADLSSIPETARFRVQLPSCKIPADTRLDEFLSKAGGLTASGEIALDLQVMVAESQPSCSVSAHLREGSLQNTNAELSLKGVSLDLEMPDALLGRSSPTQLLSIKSLGIGNFHADSLEVDFQLESFNSLLIEHSQFNWCNGKVQTPAIRLARGIDDYEITLYCDRLVLADILEQFGVTDATGGGAVNGLLPVHFSKGGIAFLDGFLYSTPGSGGRIKLSGTDALIAGLSPDSTQYVQMDIAREALKDFEYSWAKMNLHTENGELDIRLQFDGKPAALLPFEYKKELGRFIRVDAEAEGSQFEGIRLDVNFHLPINDIIKYKGVMDLIQ